MDFRIMILVCLGTMLAVLLAVTEGRNKKVVIHVPYKLKKIKHTHTVYKTIHHHHTHHDHEHAVKPSDDYDHFHVLHLHDDATVGAHSQPAVGIGIPEFLPDVPYDDSLEKPDIPLREIHGHRHMVPLYRRH